MEQSVVALKRKMVSSGWCSVNRAINCVKSGGSTEAPPVNQEAVCGQNAKIRESAAALEMPPSCGSAGVKLGEDLRQTQTAGYEIHPESTDQHQTQIGLKMERDCSALLQKHLLLKGFYPSCI